MDGAYGAEATANNYVLIYGDVRAGFYIVDRIGTTFELIPNLVGANQRHTGQRGALLWFRAGSEVVIPEALRLLDIPPRCDQFVTGRPRPCSSLGLRVFGGSRCLGPTILQRRHLDGVRTQFVTVGTMRIWWMRLKGTVRNFPRYCRSALRKRRVRYSALGVVTVVTVLLGFVVTSPPWTLGIDASSGQWSAFGTMTIALVATGVSIAEWRRWRREFAESFRNDFMRVTATRAGVPSEFAIPAWK